MVFSFRATKAFIKARDLLNKDTYEAARYSGLACRRPKVFE
jgi:hypothetical protein